MRIASGRQRLSPNKAHVAHINQYPFDDMTERRRPGRRGRRPSPRRQAEDQGTEPSPYRNADEGDSAETTTTRAESVDSPRASAPSDAPPMNGERVADVPAPERPADACERRRRRQSAPSASPGPSNHRQEHHGGGSALPPSRGRYGTSAIGAMQRSERSQRSQRTAPPASSRSRPSWWSPGNEAAQAPPAPVVADTETVGWFDPSRDGGFIRRAGEQLPRRSRRRLGCAARRQAARPAPG